MNTELQAGEVVSEGVERLMAEIDRAVNLIERLRRENGDLKQQCKGLQEKGERQEADLARLRSERDRLQKIYEENASLIEKKGDIQSKIEGMLARLNAIDIE